MTLETLYKNTIRLSKKDIAIKGRAAYIDLKNELISEGIPEEEVATFISELVAAFVGVDRWSDHKEHRLFKSVFDTDIEFGKFWQFAQTGENEAATKKAIAQIKGLPASSRSLAATLALCFIAVDGEISEAEHKLLEGIIE